MPKTGKMSQDPGDDVVQKGVSTYQLAEARAMFTSLVNHAATAGRRSVINRFGKPVAALVPIQDLHRLLDADVVAQGASVRDTTGSRELVSFAESGENEPETEYQGNSEATLKLQQLGALFAEIMSLKVVRDYVEDRPEKKRSQSKASFSPAQPSKSSVERTLLQR